MNEHWEYKLNPTEKELASLLLAHLQHYPEATLPDLVKLLYQRAHGPGHLVTSESSSLSRLQEEAKAAAPTPHLIENLGNGFVRIQIGSWSQTGLSLPILNRMFIQTPLNHETQTPQEDAQTTFHNSLSILEKFCALNILPFDLTESRTWLTAYKEKGSPIQSHTNHYRQTYKPAYRVIDANYVPLFPLLAKLESQLASISNATTQTTTPSLTIAIDGRSGSGKSTVAKLLAGLFPSTIIEVDDFFLPQEKRTPERYAEPGGNVDYERFQEEVAQPLQSHKKTFSYRIFDCSIMDFNGVKQVPETTLTIIEGSYSQSPRFGRYYDMAIFVDIDPETQIARIKKRNPHMADRFASTWIPLEEKYFATYQVASNADFIVRLP